MMLANYCAVNVSDDDDDTNDTVTPTSRKRYNPIGAGLLQSKRRCVAESPPVGVR